MKKRKKIGEQSRLAVRFSVYNFGGSPDEVTKILKVEPTRVQSKGDIIPRSGRRVAFNSWSYSVPSESYDLEEQMKILLRKLKRLPILKQKIGKCDLHINAILEIIGEDTQPIVVMPHKQIAKLAEFGIGFGVDYYFFPK